MAARCADRRPSTCAEVKGTPDLAANWERFAKIISHRVPFTDVQTAYDLAGTPGAADKVVVIFND